MAASFVDLWAKACAGVLTVRSVKIHLTRGNITPQQAQELITKINEVASAPAAAPTVVTGGRVYEIETFVEELRANRINAGGEVDEAWRDIPELRRLCGRQQPRGKRVVTGGLDPFALRVLRYVFGKLFDENEVEGLRIIGLFSYADLRRIADQGAHEKRLRQLNGPFDRGVLTKSTVGDMSRRGLGVPVTVLDGEELTGLLVQHYNGKAFVVSSFEELESAATALSGQGGLDLVAVQKAKESGKLVQVTSPGTWEQGPEEQRLQRLLGPEYWYLGSETPLKDEEFAVMIANHRCMQEDGTLLPDPLLDLLADRLSGDGMVVTADDLWSHFKGGRPAAGAPLPQRPRSVFHSSRLAAYFAGRLGLPADVVEKYFTRHHDLAEEILARQSAVRKVARGVTQADVAIGPAVLPFGSIAGVVAGAIAGLLPAVILRSPISLPIGVIVGAVLGGLAPRLVGKLNTRGRRLGVVGVVVLSLLVTCVSCGIVQTIAVSQKTMQGMDYWRRAEELGLYTPSEPTATTEGIPTPMVVGLLTILGISVVVGVLLVVGIIILRKRKRP